MANYLRRCCLLLLCLALAEAGIDAIAQAAVSSGQNNPAPSASAATEILSPADAAKLMPPSVFFRGQIAPIQARNSSGIRFADGMHVLITLVDNSGYSSAIQQSYQAYLITEVPLEFEGNKLPAGAYGFGFRANQFVIMDLGSKELFSLHSIHDMDLHRPMPLQIVAKDAGKTYRIYEGRDGVMFSRSN